jgi:hypothetical protein
LDKNIKKYIYISAIFLFITLTVGNAAAVGDKVQEEYNKEQGSEPVGNQEKKQDREYTEDPNSTVEVMMAESSAPSSPGTQTVKQSQNQNVYQYTNQVLQQTQEMYNAQENMGEAPLQQQTQNQKQVQVQQQVQNHVLEQIQDQKQIQQGLNKLESKGDLAKKLFGPDYQAIKLLKQQIEQNQLRIAQLNQLQNEVQNQAEQTQLSELIQAMVNQNTALQEKIQTEEKIKSLFGWLAKLFV